jgi:hypothetical protein
MKGHRVLPILLLSTLAWLAAASQVQPAPKVAAPYRAWTGPDGQPLPFQSDAEVLEFLRTAKVVSDKGIPRGVTAPHKLLLEKDGVRANSVFRRLDEQRADMVFAAGTREINFRDSYLFEPAAYELATLLGLDNVPPAIVRSIGGNTGSLQIWLEQAVPEDTRVKQKRVSPDPRRWVQYGHLMKVFDALIYNTDRNQGNLLTTPDWKLWFIDHTRAFRLHTDFPPTIKLTQCDRRLLQRLTALDANTVRERLKPYLRKAEIAAVLKRRDRLVQYFNRLIAEQGEEQVLFDFDPPETTRP